MRRLLCRVLFCVLFFYSGYAQAAMTSGTTTNGTIPSGGGTSTQTFTGTAGQEVFLFATASFSVNIRVLKPDGSYWTNANDRFIATLPSTGTFTVVLSAVNPANSGSYGLNYVRGAAAVKDGSLTSGTTHSGSLTANNLQSYTFTGTAGQEVDLFVTASYTMNIRVLKPDGSYWYNANDRFTGALPATGTYTVVLYAWNSLTQTGSYGLNYVRGADAVKDGSLTSGTTHSGSLTANNLQSYTFTGTAGQEVDLFVTASYTMNIRVLKPDGSYWTNANDRFIAALPVTGTYTVVLYAYNSITQTGSYGLNYVRGADAVKDGSLTSGTTHSGTLTANNLQSYTFTGTAGQEVDLFVTASYTMNIRVLKPDGSYWYNANDRFIGTLPATGTYTVVLYAWNSLTNSGSYGLNYVRGADAVKDGSLTSGTTHSGSLTANNLQSYSFTGTAGQEVDLFVTASYTMNIRVLKPDGSYWTNANDRFIAALPATGTYTVVLYAYNSITQTGAYGLHYVRGADAVHDGALTSGTTHNGTLGANGLQSYSFEGTAGQGIILYTTAPYTMNIRVIKPDGSYWTNNNDRVLATLPSTGTYTVVLYAWNSLTNSGTYDLHYVRGADSVSDGTLVTTQTRSGTLGANGLESYKFSGVAGNAITVASTGSYTRRIYIYKPDGSYWTNVNNSLTSTLPAGATGDYTLVMFGNLATDTGAYSLTTTTVPAPVDPTDPTKDGVDETDCEEAARKGNSTGGTGSTANNMVGNPLNFDVGYKKQTETDYNAGGLYFSRIYRSDSTWTNNTIGELWRHNYARTLTVGSTTVEITDGTGATTHYTLSGGNWVADDADIEATFENDGSGGYIYTLPDNTVEKYNSSKRLTRIEYLGGGALNLAYNGSGQLTSVTNENGRSLTLTYASGRVATLVTPDGTFSYAYDANGNLTTVTKPDTKTIQYHYENTTYINALTGITDEEGVRFATFGYDAGGKAILSEHAGNVSDYTVTYNADGTSTTTNPLGKQTTFYYANILGLRKVVQVNGEASTNCVAANQYYNYDSDGRVISKTDWQGNTTRYAYDSRGNVTQVIEAADTPEQRITTTTYESIFNLPDVITETDKTTNYTYDAYGRTTSVTVTDTTTSETRTTSYTYHSNTTDPNGNLVLGRLAQINGPRTDVTDTTDFDYDANLNLIKITNALGQESEITARDAAGRPTTIENVNDVETNLVYDTNGRLDSSTVAPGTGLAATTSYDYDDNGNLVQITLPNGGTLEYAYDNAQRLTGIEDALGNTISYTLDNAGNTITEEIHDTTPTLKYTHSQVFDEMSRIIESVGAASQTQTFAYDKNSNLTNYTDANTNPTAYAYDGLQRLVDETDALSGVTELTYNARDDLTGVEDPRNNTTTYTFNAFGDVTAESSPDRGATSYVVDKAGNITQRTDAHSAVTNYTYDALNRLLTVAYPSDSSLNATLTYDLTSGCGSAGVGRLCTVTDASGSTAYEYNDLGQLTDVTETRGGLSFATAYGYDLAGVLTGITLPSGRTITYTLDANKQVSGVSATISGSGTTLASSITYLPFGPMTGMTYGNSLTFTAAYDTDYRLTSRAVSSIYTNAYATDDNGNITQKGSVVYAYDALNRMNGENSGSAVTYTYDANDNRLTKVAGSTTTTTVPSTNNKISAVGGASYTYDAAGNITADGTNTYVWYASGLLKESKVGGSTVGAYTYDSQNHRTKKVAGGNTIQYVYGVGGLLLGEYDNSGVLIREYIYLNGQPLAQIDAGSPEVLTYIHNDHLGTPRYGTNTGGAQVWVWNSDAFGVGSPSGAATVNLRMPGQYFDSESGLFYNWNRYYNPAIGRYISSDPIGLDGGLNTFSYVKASPVMYTDPEGLKIQCIYSIADAKMVCVNDQGVVSVFGEDGEIISGGGGTRNSDGEYEPKYPQCVNNPECEDKKNIGPIPSGEYKVTPNSNKPHWWSLDDKDWWTGISGMACEAGYRRCGSNFHAGNYSNGCITFKGSKNKDWERLEKIFEKHKDTGIDVKVTPSFEDCIVNEDCKILF